MSRASALDLGSSTGSLGSSIGSSTGLIPNRPQLTHGVAAGDVRADGGLIWTRADRPSRMIVETSADPSFRKVRRFESSHLMTPDTDGTGRVRLVGMEPGQRVHYRVMAQDAETGILSAPEVGSFVTAPTAHKDIRLHWSGDVAGQGYGINPEIGGMYAFATMASRNPDLFIHSGDTCYADGPITATKTLDDGRTYTSLTSEAKSKVAETLTEFRGQYAYNLMDANYRAFNAHVAQLVQWDDHETVNNWYPGEVLDSDKYTVKDVDTLSSRAFQAFHEWQPLDPTMAVDGRVYRKVSYGPLLDIFVLDMRSYKDANPLARTAPDQPGHILGDKQAEWLIREVNASTATWKIIANDLPLGIIVPDQRPPWRCHGSRGRDWPRALGHQEGEERRVAHRRCALHRGSPLQPGSRELPGFLPVLGVRRRSPQCRCVRAEQNGQHLRPVCGVHSPPAQGPAELLSPR